jgi:hypothetical protein
MAGGAAVHTPAEDLKLAQTYADAYAKANGIPSKSKSSGSTQKDLACRF